MNEVPSAIIQLHRRMSEDELDRELAALGRRKDAGARHDQELARLFCRSNWTQEDLAKKLGKSRSYIARELLFGRFLGFVPIGTNAENAPSNLSEGRFRSFWERTDKSEQNERIRFIAVQRLISEDFDLNLVRKRRPPIGHAIIEKFADGKWHAIGTIAKALDTDEEHVAATLHNMQALRRAYGVNCEKRRANKSDQYRIFHAERAINTSEIKTKLLPIIKGLKAEGRKRAATMSVATVAQLAALLERQLDEWVEGATSSTSRRPDEFAAIIAGVKDDDDE